MRSRPNPRVFLGLIDICGVYRSMELALRELGLSAYFLNTGNEHRSIVRREALAPRFYLYWLRRAQSPAGLARVLPPMGRRLMLKLSILLMIGWIYLKFDALLLKSGTSFTASGSELAWLKRRGKIIVYSYHGSDSRPGFLRATDLKPKELDKKTLARNHEGLVRRSAFADYIIDSPTSAHWQPKRCCLRQAIFTPAPRYAMPDAREREGAGGAVRIFHCPSDPELKGTDVIRQTVLELQEEGRAIDYVELMGVPNERVIKELQLADIAIDELYSDNYGGIFALEAMTVGTPVVVGGYAKDELDRFVPEWARAPTEYVHPDELYDRVRALVDDIAARDTSRRTVTRYTREIVAPTESARRLVQVITGEAPDSWFFEPRDIRYALGAAGPDWKVRRNIRAVLDASGAEALFLDDKPELRDVLIDAA